MIPVTTINYYECAFHYNNVVKSLRVAASSFADASDVALSASPDWDNAELFTLSLIRLIGPIVINSKV